jgi:UPF0716 protein FxsA
MNMAIWLLTAVLALPVAEIVVFVLVSAYVGFAWTLLALLAASFTGAMMLRHGGGAHIARLRVVLGAQRATALEADGAGTMYLLAAILLMIPGFITGVIGLVLLVPPLRRTAGSLIRRAAMGNAPPRPQGVVDLEPQEWRQVPEPRLPHDRER